MSTRSFTLPVHEMSGPAKAPVPNRFALIIGAMKSGTTSLFEILAQHPEIAAASVKEPSFFSNLENYQRGADWYRQLWEWDSSTHRIALEASPSYTTYPARPGVPQRIAQFADAEFRFIYILRHPFEQIESNVRHALYVGWGKSLDEELPEWMLETVEYARQLEEYLKVFDREQMLLLTLEEFSEQPGAVLRRVCEFLGVDPTFEFRRVQERYNAGDVYEVFASIAQVGKKLKLIALAKRLLPRPTYHWVRGQLVKLLPARKKALGRYKLNKSEQALVIDRLNGDLRRLEAMYAVPTRRYWSIHEGRLWQNRAE